MKRDRLVLGVVMCSAALICFVRYKPASNGLVPIGITLLLYIASIVVGTELLRQAGQLEWKLRMVWGLTLVAGLLLELFAHPMLPQMAVVVVHDLPAFTRITANDVAVIQGRPAIGSEVSNRDDVIGGISKSALRSQQALTTSMLLKLPSNTKDWLIASIDGSNGISPLEGEQVVIVGVKKNDPVGIVLSDIALVLGCSNGRISVCLPRIDALKVAAFQTDDRHVIVDRELRP